MAENTLRVNDYMNNVSDIVAFLTDFYHVQNPQISYDELNAQIESDAGQGSAIADDYKWATQPGCEPALAYLFNFEKIKALPKYKDAKGNKAPRPLATDEMHDKYLANAQKLRDAAAKRKADAEAAKKAAEEAGEEYVPNKDASPIQHSAAGQAALNVISGRRAEYQKRAEDTSISKFIIRHRPMRDLIPNFSEATAEAGGYTISASVVDKFKKAEKCDKDEAFLVPDDEVENNRQNYDTIMAYLKGTDSSTLPANINPKRSYSWAAVDVKLPADAKVSHLRLTKSDFNKYVIALNGCINPKNTTMPGAVVNFVTPRKSSAKEDQAKVPQVRITNLGTLKKAGTIDNFFAYAVDVDTASPKVKKAVSSKVFYKVYAVDENGVKQTKQVTKNNQTTTEYKVRTVRATGFIDVYAEKKNTNWISQFDRTQSGTNNARKVQDALNNGMNAMAYVLSEYQKSKDVETGMVDTKVIDVADTQVMNMILDRLNDIYKTTPAESAEGEGDRL